MPITKVEFLKDRVRVHRELSKPYGMPDVDDVIDVPYDSIDRLPRLSKAPEPYGLERDQKIYVSQVDRTIVFRHGSHMERPVGPKEEDMYGPYLKEGMQKGEILESLHNPDGELPRLEIEGIGEPSVDARFLKLFYHEGGKGDSMGSGLRRPLDIIPEEKAVYIKRDDFEDTSYVTEFDINCVHFPRRALEELVKSALGSESNEATASVEGKHEVHRERWNDFTGEHKGGPAQYRDVVVNLSLRIIDGGPSLSVALMDREVS